jgi:hypothetical protein
MSTVTKDIGTFRLPFAIRSAIVAALLGLAVATWMGTLFWSFHVDARSISRSTTMSAYTITKRLVRVENGQREAG